jgi:hypothetical protein
VVRIVIFLLALTLVIGWQPICLVKLRGTDYEQEITAHPRVRHQRNAVAPAYRGSVEIFAGEFAGNEVSSFLAGLRFANRERIRASPPQLEAGSWFGDRDNGERKLLDGHRPTGRSYPEVVQQQRPDATLIVYQNYSCEPLISAVTYRVAIQL